MAKFVAQVCLRERQQSSRTRLLLCCRRALECASERPSRFRPRAQVSVRARARTRVRTPDSNSSAHRARGVEWLLERERVRDRTCELELNRALDRLR